MIFREPVAIADGMSIAWGHKRCYPLELPWGGITCSGAWLMPNNPCLLRPTVVLRLMTKMFFAVKAVCFPTAAAACGDGLGDVAGAVALKSAKILG